MSSVENRGKSDNAAREYLEHANKNFPSALGKQCIPDDPNLWEISNFEEFLSLRRSALSDELNEFLSGITEMDLAQGLTDIVDIISEGEHDALEFKSSLRWDTKENCLNKDLEKVILKTVAAFNNSYGEGCTLLIGVDDDGNILGLENDFSTLNGEDSDAFELHLRNLLNSEFGTEFTARNIRIRFYEVSEKLVCSIDIAKGLKPLFVKFTDKSGVKTEKFFVRSGNMSQPMTSPSEITEYTSKRFI